MNNATQDHSSNVFVVYGRNDLAKREMYTFLRAIGLSVVEWEQAVALTKKGSPFVGEILDAAFRISKAVIVLLTGDDEARLRAEYCAENEAEYEKALTPQPRQNVLFEAGMAFGLQPRRTVMVEIGRLRTFSDVSGRYSIRLDNTAARRNELAQRLKSIGCAVKLDGNDWLFTGNFTFS
ncbi:MAG: nucleotide-binding protein [Ktedonobacteraceae bacterium]